LLRGTPFFEITARDAEGLNTFILLLGSIYAVMYAFVIYVIWGQFTDVEKFVMRECYSLDELLRFSRYVNADSTRAIRRALAEYSQAVLRSEWQALGKRERDPATENCFISLMTAVIRTAPANPEEATIQQRLIDIAREAGEHRDERITKSLTRIPPTLMGFVNGLSTALLVLAFVYPPSSICGCQVLRPSRYGIDPRQHRHDRPRQSIQRGIQRQFRALFPPEAVTRDTTRFQQEAESMHP
jgi:hypothetical protein